MRPTLVFRTRAARPIAVAGWVVCALAAVMILVDGVGPAPLAWTACAALVLYVVWWRPAVEVSDGGVGVRDLLRDVHVPWPALRDVESRWSLTVVTDDGRFGSWAVPAPSPSARRLRRGRGDDPAGDARSGGDETPVRDAGAAPVERRYGTAEVVASVIAARRDALRRDGHLRQDAPVPPVTSSWNVAPLAALAGLVVLALVVG
ncbi:PH domain-containing protein [Georgenia sp. Z1491]|uniref:PH domain-containing protein n=1 Tax=Georgenia sp. Z1491 TaxID=3416707 RepID=UPI003CEFF2ED